MPKKPRLDYQPLFGKGAVRGGLEKAAEIEPKKKPQQFSAFSLLPKERACVVSQKSAIERGTAFTKIRLFSREPIIRISRNLA